MTEEWLAIQHRAFWDIPRMVVVQFEGDTYLFDCPFDDQLEEYQDSFTGYRVHVPIPDADSDESWEVLTEGAKQIGQIATEDVRFDASRRQAIATDSLLAVLRPRATDSAE